MGTTRGAAGPGKLGPTVRLSLCGEACFREHPPGTTLLVQRARGALGPVLKCGFILMKTRRDVASLKEGAYVGLWDGDHQATQSCQVRNPGAGAHRQKP